VDRWANLAVLGPLQAAGGSRKALAAFQHVLETELVWLRWMDGDPDAWFDPWQAPSMDRCREWLTEADGRLAALADTLDARIDETFEFQTRGPGARRQPSTRRCFMCSCTPVSIAGGLRLPQRCR
jgi:hypothetical protein